MEDLGKLKLYDDDKAEQAPEKKRAAKGRGSGGFVGLVVILVIGLAAGFAVGYLARSGAGGVAVDTDFAIKESSARPVVTRKESGWIEVPDDQYPLYITALTTGRLEVVKLRKGMEVVAGQEIAQVYAGYLENELEKADSEYRKAEADYMKMKNGYRKQEVAQAEARADKASALVKKSEASLAKAEANLIELRLQMDLANVTYIRAIPLVKTEAISEQRLDELRSDYEESKARRAEARAAVAVAAAEIDLAKAAHVEAVEEFKLMEEGYRREDIMGAEAEMNRLRAERDLAALRFENRKVISQWTGIILHQYKHAGDLVAYPGKEGDANPRIASVYNPGKLQARIQLDLDRVEGILIGQKVLITTEIEGPTVTYDGKVIRKDPEADYKNNVVWVKVDILNPSGKLHPEMVCKAQFLAREQAKTAEGKATQHVVIPYEAVVERGGKTFVFTIENGKARSIAVELSGSVGGKRVVKKGLSGGEELITSGHASISDGTPVRKRSGK